MPVMADDIAFDFNHAVECLRHNACDVISVYPGKNGGIRKARRIAELAAQHGVACSIGSNLEWDVATAAMCHLVVGTPNMQIEKYPGDVLGPEYHEFPVVKEPLRIDGPVITTPDGPGLGVEVDWGVVEQHRM
jgi:muconate cycloisomerase